MKQKKIPILFFGIILSILLAIFTDILFFNYGLIEKKLQGFKKVKYSKEQMITSEGSTELTVGDNKSVLIGLPNINARLSFMTLKMDFQENSKTIYLYFKESEEEQNAEAPSQRVMLTRSEEGSYSFPLDFNMPVESLVIEVTGYAGEDLIINGAEFNYNLSISPSFKRLPVEFIIILLLFILCFMPTKYFSFDILVSNRYKIALIVFAFLVAFKIHGSSIGMWDNYITDTIDPTLQTNLWGGPRSIRSDEWLVQTPFYLSQELNKDFFPIINENVRSEGQNALLAYYSPVWDITLLGKPFNWGFILFDAEQGLSWYWCLKLIMLFLFALELGLILTGSSRMSFLMAMVLSLAPPVQWWYNTAVVDGIIFALGMIITFGNYLRLSYKSFGLRLINLLVFLICTTGFVLNLYPALQVPVGYMVLIFFVYFIFKYKRKELFKKRDVIAIAVAFGIFVCILARFVLTSLGALSIVLNTAYPGKRFVSGGAYDYRDIFNYLLAWLLPYKEVSYSNPSELSMFIMLLPELLVGVLSLMVISIRKLMKSSAKGKGLALKASNTSQNSEQEVPGEELRGQAVEAEANTDKGDNTGLIIALFLYLIFMLFFILIGYPALFVKVTLLSFTTEARLTITLGLVAAILVVLVFNELNKKKLNRYLCLTFTALILYGYYRVISISYAGIYFNTFDLIVTLIAFGVLSFSFLSGLKGIFVFAMSFFMLITGGTVNPVARGLAPLYNKTLSAAVKSINEEEAGTWVTTESIITSNFLIAQGVKVFNGVHNYPDLKLWKTFDIEGQYEDIYNRYAHVLVTINEQETTFNLLQQDTIEFSVSLQDFYKTGIKYIVAPRDLSTFSPLKGSFKELWHSEKDNLYIFKFIE